MSAERDIFCAALERKDPAERRAFLSAGVDSPATRARIDALLRAADAAGGFLSAAEATGLEAPGARIDRYRLGERIGEGGFGVVYRAGQERPVRRTVALKIIKPGMDTRAVVARFEAERQALALMDHPHIARVFDGGATEAGRPYFVMELVRGEAITAFCSSQRLRVSDRLELFLQVCGAVHHAHQKGIIHRDLKPTNILVASADGRPVAKVIDFGIAKATREPLTEKTLLTRQHLFIGTPAYMSPEQVGTGNGDVDTRSDIYSLGALLYELLCEAPVLDAAALLARGYGEVQRAIQLTEPRPPSQRIMALPPEARRAAAARRQTLPERWAAELRGDLDRIVLKCLEKERARRYETTDELAGDIARYLRHEPVRARRATLGYRTTKFVRRHRRGVSAVAASILLLAGSVVYHTRNLAAERDRAQFEARKAAKVSELLSELLVAGDPFRTPTAHDVLDASAARVRQDFPTQPDVRAEILSAVGRVHLRRGDHARARPVLQEALRAGRQIGRPDARVAQALSDLGVLRRETGDVAGAVPLFEEALDLRRLLRGNDHNEVAISLVELGRAHVALERLDLAEPLFREALAIRQRVLGEEHREVAVSLGDLGRLLWQQGELAAAEPFLLASLAMHRTTVGPDHPNVAAALANLAQLRIDQAALTEAEALLREALPIVQRSFGEVHWRTARMLGQLGEVLRRQRRPDEAGAMLEQAWVMARNALGPDQPDMAALAIERACVDLDRGDAATAETRLREALRVQLRTCGEDSWRVAATRSLLGAALLELGRLVEAESQLLTASRRLPDLPGPQGRETAPTRERLALLARAAVEAESN